MEASWRVGTFAMKSVDLATLPFLPVRSSPFHPAHILPKRSLAVSVFRSSLPGSEVAGEDVLQIFLKERQLSGDLITRVSDELWWRDDLKFIDSENGTVLQNLEQFKEMVEEENTGGFLKLTETREWISGDNVAPVNNRSVAKERQNDSERRKKLNLLNYEALKRELMLLTTGIGASCSGYCLVILSVQAAISYAAGVLLSCLYLQLLYHHADSLTKETIPQIFMQKKSKKIGIRSEDLTNLLERILKGSTIALSSPRLIIPAAIYGLWALSQHFFSDYFDFQLVPAMFGLFAYKAAALVQVYRDNEDLKLVFQESDEDQIDS